MSRDLEDENYYTSRGGMIPMKWTAIEVSIETTVYSPIRLCLCIPTGTSLQEVLHSQ